MKRRLWVLIVGLGILFPLCAQGAAATLSEDIAFDQEQYAMLLRCSEKGDVTEWNEWMAHNYDSQVHRYPAIRLQNANLRFANLRGVNLRWANLRNANLEGADFTSADLVSSNLSAANLKDASFQAANLIRADLSLASFQGANFDAAKMMSTLYEIPDTKESADLKEALTMKLSALQKSQIIFIGNGDLGVFTSQDKVITYNIVKYEGGGIAVVGVQSLVLGPVGLTAKPVVYLYPQEVTDITVKLDYNGTLEYTYPAYREGWKVTAQPDGTLTNHADGREYSYLFWEGQGNMDYDFREGFVVKGSDTVSFLQEKLAFMGLTPREYNEFIVYWLPQMQNNPYNLISFQGLTYTDNAVLTVVPKPDSVLRVFMTFKALKEAIEIQPQKLTPFDRKGFVLVEWGGSACN